MYQRAEDDGGAAVADEFSEPVRSRVGVRPCMHPVGGVPNHDDGSSTSPCATKVLACTS
jgi:hypothetical protein